jgi:hypothetical protein
LMILTTVGTSAALSYARASDTPKLIIYNQAEMLRITKLGLYSTYGGNTCDD